MDLLPTGDQYVEMITLKRLTAKFGPVENHGGQLIFSKKPSPSEDEIVAVREQVRTELYRFDVKAEVRRRILAVVKDEPTQINMLGWLLLNQNTDNGFLINDLTMAQRIIEWVSAVQFTGRTLVNEPTYFDDKHWPKPPDGARKFMERF